MKPPLEQRGSIISVLIPTNGYFITPILIWLNAIVFAIMAIAGVDLMSPTTENLLA